MVLINQNKPEYKIEFDVKRNQDDDNKVKFEIVLNSFVGLDAIIIETILTFLNLQNLTYKEYLKHLIVNLEKRNFGSYVVESKFGVVYFKTKGFGYRFFEIDKTADNRFCLKHQDITPSSKSNTLYGIINVIVDDVNNNDDNSFGVDSIQTLLDKVIKTKEKYKLDIIDSIFFSHFFTTDINKNLENFQIVSNTKSDIDIKEDNVVETKDEIKLLEDLTENNVNNINQSDSNTKTVINNQNEFKNMLSVNIDKTTDYKTAFEKKYGKNNKGNIKNKFISISTFDIDKVINSLLNSSDKNLYNEFVNNLKKKYGSVDKPYFTNKECKKISKLPDSKKHLSRHHIFENQFPNLSGDKAKNLDWKYQLPDALVYCNMIEHIILHLIIFYCYKQQNYDVVGSARGWFKNVALFYEKKQITESPSLENYIAIDTKIWKNIYLKLKDNFPELFIKKEKMKELQK